MININNLFVKLLWGQTLTIETEHVGRLINYCKGLSGDYAFDLTIKKGKVKIKMK